MKSPFFSKMKRLRCKRALQRDVKQMKKFRVRKDRYHTKKILHIFQDDSKLKYYILRNNGGRHIV